MVHIFRKSFLKAAQLAAAILMMLPVLIATPAFAITCEECQEIDKNRRAYSDELEQKSQELKAAFEKRAYDKVSQINVRLNDLRKQLAELSKHNQACVDACKPETVKAHECRGIKLEIRKLESEGLKAADQMKKIDDLYRDLLKCNQDLRRMLGDEE